MNESNSTNTNGLIAMAGGVQDFQYGGNTKATPPTKPTVIQAYFPSATDIIEALQSPVDSTAYQVVSSLITQGYKQPLRLQVIPKKGATTSPYAVPQNFAEFLANEDKRAASLGARGEALAIRRDAIDSLVMHCTSLGLPETVTSLLKIWVTAGACSGLSSQPEDTRSNVAVLAQKWIESLDDLDKVKFTSFIGQLSEALKGNEVTADAFSVA